VDARFLEKLPGKRAQDRGRIEGGKTMCVGGGGGELAGIRVVVGEKSFGSSPAFLPPVEGHPQRGSPMT